MPVRPPPVPSLLALALIALAAPARAEEPRGCGGFRWPVAREQAALTAPALPQARPGEVRAPAREAFRLPLRPLAEAALPRPPERVKGDGGRAGHVAFAPPAPGLHQVALSAAAWVDLVQGEAYLAPVAFSGALDCPGLRKLVRFRVGAAPVVLQLSGAEAEGIDVVFEPVTEVE